MADKTCDSTSFEQRVRDFKWMLAAEALAACGGNKAAAARSLKISRVYLHRLLHKADKETER